MKPEIPCDTCHGKGRVPLPEHLRETLSMIAARARITATDLHARNEHISPNAFSNRLFELRRLGFLKRERDGKFWRYSRA